MNKPAFFLLLSALLTPALSQAEETAKIQCHGQVGDNSMGELTAYVNTQEIVIEKLTFQYHVTGVTTVATNLRFPESSLSSWPFYYYRTDRDARVPFGSYHYTISLNKELLDQRYTGPLYKGKFSVKASDDGIHVVHLFGYCRMSW